MKTQLISLLVFGFILVGLHPSARADRHGEDYNDFAQLIRQTTDLAMEDLYSGSGGSSSDLSPEILSRLKDVAEDQAFIWGDTILEGDYVADGKTQLDRVEGVYLNQELVAYRITYSERAWYIGDCAYEDMTHESFEGCESGLIVESSYVSPDFSSWMRDLDAIADFESNN